MKKVLLGLSGGIDSAISIYVLKRAGYEVEALTLHMCDTKNFELDLLDAKKICKFFNIKHHTLDVRKEFKKEVVDYFVNEYKNARTPNPCCKCNREIKFKYLFDTCNKMKFDYIATGHYARKCVVEYNNKKRYAIKIANDNDKDQAYVLYNLDQNQIKHTLFPLSYLKKEEVRKIAKFLNLKIYNKKDSLDVCFIKDIKYNEFIKQNDFGKDYKERIALGEKNNNIKLIEEIEKAKYLKQGFFINKNGKVLGIHKGIINYTIGQRKGLNISLSNRAYVININKDNLNITLGEDKDLYKNELFVKNINLQAIEKIKENEKIENCICKIRYKDKGEYCTLEKKNELIYVKFSKDVRAITPGQAAVFYKEDVILGGGEII